MVIELNNQNEYDNSILTIIDEFSAYRSQYRLMFKYPIFLFSALDRVQDFIELCVKYKEDPASINKVEFKIAWASLKVYALTHNVFKEKSNPEIAKLLVLKNAIREINELELIAELTLVQKKYILRTLKENVDSHYCKNIIKIIYNNACNEYENIEVEETLKFELNNFDSYSNIISDFRLYQTDLVKMMERPILANVLDNEVKKFSLMCRKIERQEISIPLTDFEVEWENLLIYADTIRFSQFNNKQLTKFNDSKNMLMKAFNIESTDNEKELSIKGLERNLSGILPINESIISRLKNQVGLKELVA